MNTCQFRNNAKKTNVLSVVNVWMDSCINDLSSIIGVLPVRALKRMKLAKTSEVNEVPVIVSQLSTQIFQQVASSSGRAFPGTGQALDPILIDEFYRRKEMRFERFPIVIALLLSLCVATAPMFGQSLTTGNISGTVLDPSRAVVPGATVNLKGLDTGSQATTTANASGSYNFSLLKPGRYKVSVKQPGFAEVDQTVEVQVGQTSNVEID